MGIDDFDGEAMNETELEQLADNMLENHSTELIVMYLKKAPGRLRKRRALMQDELRRLSDALQELGEL